MTVPTGAVWSARRLVGGSAGCPGGGRDCGCGCVSSSAARQVLAVVAGLVTDGVLGGGSDARIVRRLGSVLIMVAGAATGAVLVRLGAAIAIGLASALGTGAAVVFGCAPEPATTS